MRTAALVTLLAFGCATARPPAAEVLAPPGPAPGQASIGLAEPDLELWMEGTKAIDPRESAQTLDLARSALSEALSHRGLEASDPEQLLVVHAREIAVTQERKSAQVWSAVGAVVAVVAVVVIAIIAATRGRGSSRGSSSLSHAPVAAPAHAGARVPGRVAYVPRPYAPPPPIGVSVGFNVMVPLGPVPMDPGLPRIESRLSSRGWWDGDEVELTLELVDPRTGQVSWQRVVREGVDPRDPKAMTSLVDRALADVSFGVRMVPLAPPPVPPAG
jgi:hypothetical protein